MSGAPIDLHEWISFEDPDEHRTWVFDATFLRSNYTCIYGQGCPGIDDELAPERAIGCCRHGAHFVDAGDVANVDARFERLDASVMQYYKRAKKKGYRKRGDPDDEGHPTMVTKTLDGGCIFLNRPGFEGGVGCALHIAALAAGERPLDWKPEVCWQVPLRLEHSSDESGHVTSRLREWKRRDWGDGGDEFAWWCTEDSTPEATAFVGAAPLYRSARDEIVELVGAHIYETLVPLLERAEWVPLPHPAVRPHR
ncbi:MAG: hypothetical protein AAFY28_08480 [Actinomycetota bacterium]